MKFGQLTKDATNNNAPFTGKIACRQLRANLQLRPETNRSQNAPDYSVWANEGAGAYQLGNAWKKTSPKCPEFLSITLDSPDFDAPINVTAFPADAAGGVFDIVWERPKLSRQKQAVDTQAPADEAGPF